VSLKKSTKAMRRASGELFSGFVATCKPSSALNPRRSIRRRSIRRTLRAAADKPAFNARTLSLFQKSVIQAVG